ncbi:MAG: gamma-glutamylcyclotransferase family protein [Myxococcota bacterium]
MTGGAGGSAGTGAGEWLVVYGSLMRGLPAADGAEVDLLDRLGVGAGLRRIGACRVAGALFDLGAYPGLCASPHADDVVCGELHAVLDPGVFAVLDRFEGFDPADRAGSDYVRERVALLEPRGVSAWIYVYNRRPDPNRRIGSGDWRRHLAERADPAHDPR